MDYFFVGWLCGLIATGLVAFGLSYCEPKSVAKATPAWMAVWCLRVGAYIQSMGRECYHQCPHEKQCTIHEKLEKVYGTHEA